MRWISRLTAVAVVIIVAASFALLIRAKVPTESFGGSFRTYAKLRDGSRLAVGSPVVIAGVRVGVIDKLTVDGRLARVDMRLRDGLDLPADSFAERRADSLFGDSYIEIVPSGDDDSRKLASGDQIIHVIEGGSTDAVLRGIATALPHIDNTLNIIHDGVIDSRRYVSGTLDDRLSRATSWLDRRASVEDPLDQADHGLVRFEQITTSGADAVSRAGPQVISALDRFDRGVRDARQQMASFKTGFAEAMGNARDGINSIDPQIDQATDVMTAINNGSGDDWRGTLGRLVNDPKPGEEIDETVIDVREAIASFTRLRSWVGLRVEYDIFSKDVRFYASGEIRARAGKFYLVEIERGPLGGLPSDELSDAIGNAQYTRSAEIQDSLRITAQFGKQVGPVSGRIGLKDSTVGAGVDLRLLDDRVKLSADLFGSFVTTPRLKLSAALDVYRQIYLITGIDDALNSPGYLPVIAGQAGANRVFQQIRYGRDWFVGSMLVLNDDDLASILRVYGALIIGLL